MAMYFFQTFLVALCNNKDATCTVGVSDSLLFMIKLNVGIVQSNIKCSGDINGGVLLSAV
jgi:hypothetical protein